MTNDHQPTTDPSNTSQADAWDGDDGDLWTVQAERFDESLANYHGPFLSAAAIGPHDHVLDVGCGNGQTTRDAARLASRGSALGVDLSSQMVSLARTVAATEGLTNVEFTRADAQIHPFETGAYDVVISRMGSMFFGDPVAAFTNLHRSLRSGGRVTLLAWQGMAENEWISELRAVQARGRALPAPPPDAPSPFAFADPDRARTILAGAGFVDITIDAQCEPLSVGPDLGAAFEFVSALTSSMREGLDKAEQDAALAGLQSSLSEHAGEHGVCYGSAAWLIQAHKA
jgi:SAM-dependent methyltransferase